jgi:hypothetical protein
VSLQSKGTSEEQYVEVGGEKDSEAGKGKKEKKKRPDGEICKEIHRGIHDKNANTNQFLPVYSSPSAFSMPNQFQFIHAYLPLPATKKILYHGEKVSEN